MLGKINISKIRGTTVTSSYTVEGFKVLPTYHPAAIFRQYELRLVTVLDLIKARRESEFPEIRRPARSIWIDPPSKTWSASMDPTSKPARSFLLTLRLLDRSLLELVLRHPSRLQSSFLLLTEGEKAEIIGRLPQLSAKLSYLYAEFLRTQAAAQKVTTPIRDILDPDHKQLSCPCGQDWDRCAKPNC